MASVWDRVIQVTVAESFNRKALEAGLNQIVAASIAAAAPASSVNGAGAVPSAGATGVGAGAAAAFPNSGIVCGGGGAMTVAAPATPVSSPLSRTTSGGMSPAPMAVTTYPEVSYVRTPHGEAAEIPGDVFFFDYGATTK